MTEPLCRKELYKHVGSSPPAAASIFSGKPFLLTPQPGTANRTSIHLYSLCSPWPCKPFLRTECKRSVQGQKDGEDKSLPSSGVKSLDRAMGANRLSCACLWSLQKQQRAYDFCWEADCPAWFRPLVFFLWLDIWRWAQFVWFFLSGNAPPRRSCQNTHSPLEGKKVR